MFNILLANDTYQASARRRVVSGLKNIDLPSATRSNTRESLTEWDLSLTHDSIPIFEHVDTTPSYGSTVFIYNDQMETHAMYFLHSLPAELRSHFSNAQDFFDPAKLYHCSSSHSPFTHEACTQRLATIYTQNQQDNLTLLPLNPGGRNAVISITERQILLLKSI